MPEITLSLTDEQYKEILNILNKSNNLSNIKLLIQNYKNDLQKLLINEKLQEFELEYLIQKFKLNIWLWSLISQYQTLSEEFINKYKDSVHWDNISIYQILSEEFIKKHLNLVNWDDIYQCQTLSEQFIEKYKDLID